MKFSWDTLEHHPSNRILSVCFLFVCQACTLYIVSKWRNWLAVFWYQMKGRSKKESSGATSFYGKFRLKWPTPSKQQQVLTYFNSQRLSCEIWENMQLCLLGSPLRPVQAAYLHVHMLPVGCSKGLLKEKKRHFSWDCELKLCTQNLSAAKSYMHNLAIEQCKKCEWRDVWK